MANGWHHPRTVGLFVLGAIFVAAGTLIFVGSMGLFSREVRCVLYFDESVNGLYVGAPIKYKGVPIGRVSDIRIHYNQPENSSAVPVFVRIDARRLEGELGKGLEPDGPQLFGTPISNGLRGMLQLESFITGQLFIELDYVADAETGAPRFRQIEPVYPEIPTVPSIMARLGTETTDLFARLSSLDYRGLVEETLSLVRLVRERMEPLQTEKLQADLEKLLLAAQEWLDPQRLDQLSGELSETLQSVRTTSDAARGDMKALSGSADSLAVRTGTVLSGMESLVEEVNLLVESGSPLRRDLESALTDFADLSRHLAELIRLLERNPSSLLRGRPASESSPEP